MSKAVDSNGLLHLKGRDVEAGVIMRSMIRLFTKLMRNIGISDISFTLDKLYITPHLYVVFPPIYGGQVKLISTSVSDLLWERNVLIEDLIDLLEIMKMCFDDPRDYHMIISDLTCHIKPKNDLVSGHFFVPAGVFGGQNSDQMLFKKTDLERATEELLRLRANRSSDASGSDR